MSSTVTRCTLRGVYNDDLGHILISEITATKTPQAFDEQLKSYPALKLNYTGLYGYFSLAAAAEYGNIPLIKHIALKDPTLQDIGTDAGMTPLLCAVHKNHRAAVKALIDLGSKVNMAPDRFAYIGYDDGIPPGTTPLAFVAQKVHRFDNWEQRRIYLRETLHPYEIQKAQNVAMAKLLLLNGAVAEPAVNEEGTKVLQQAKKEIDEMRSSLIQKIYEAPELVDVGMPRSLVKIIADYVPLDEIPETVPELPDPEWPHDPYRSEFPYLPPDESAVYF